MPTTTPLDWPPGWPRTAEAKREDGRNRFARGSGSSRMFWTIQEAEKSLREELRLLKAKNVIVSCDLSRRLDGGIRSGQRIPDDPGVAVYFEFDGQPSAMARDEFQRIEENVRSLALSIEGMRQMKRHGGGHMVKRAFSGFAALPPPDAAIEMPGPGALPRPWHGVLGVEPNASWSEIRSAYRDQMREADDAMKLALNLAYAAAKVAHGGDAGQVIHTPTLSTILDRGRTPEQWVVALAGRGIVVTGRTLRERANAIGACHKIGRAMIITPEDMDRILEDGKCRSKSTPEARHGGLAVASSSTGVPSAATTGAALAHLQKQARATGAGPRKNGRSGVISLATKHR